MGGRISEEKGLGWKERWGKKEQKERDKEKGTKHEVRISSTPRAFIVNKMKITFMRFLYRN